MIWGVFPYFWKHPFPTVDGQISASRVRYGRHLWCAMAILREELGAEAGSDRTEAGSRCTMRDSHDARETLNNELSVRGQPYVEGFLSTERLEQLRLNKMLTNHF